MSKGMHKISPNHPTNPPNKPNQPTKQTQPTNPPNNHSNQPIQPTQPQPPCSQPESPLIRGCRFRGEGALTEGWRQEVPFSILFLASLFADFLLSFWLPFWRSFWDLWPQKLFSRPSFLQSLFLVAFCWHSRVQEKPEGSSSSCKGRL